MMREEQPAEMNKLIKKMKRIYSIISYGFLGGDYDKVLRYIEQEEELIKHFQGDISEEIKRFHTFWLYLRSLTYIFKGDLARSFKNANNLLMISKLYDHKRGISAGTFALGRYYWISGDLDKALIYFDRAIRLIDKPSKELGDFIYLSDQFFMATRVSIDKEDLERANKYFKRLEEIRELPIFKSFSVGEKAIINDAYRLTKVYLLKSSMRSRNRVMAEDLFREIIEDDRSFFMYKLRALIGLCELLLVELRVSNDINIIGEIKPLIEKLIDMAQKSGLDFYLIEAYILYGKLALVIFDMDTSRRYLTQAQRIAESHGYNGLADEIAGLHEAMMEKKDTWEQMEKRNAPLSERMDLARLDDHLKGKFRRLMMRMERAADTPPKKEVF